MKKTGASSAACSATIGSPKSKGGDNPVTALECKNARQETAGLFFYFFASTRTAKTSRSKHTIRMDKPTNPTDQEISVALTGNEAEMLWAIEQIYERHQRGLFAKAFAVLRSREDAEDAVQKTVLAVYEKAKSRTWTLDAMLTSFLYRTARNKAVDIVRKRMQGQRIWDAIEEDQKGVLPVSADEVSDRLSKVEGQATFEKFVGSLSPKEKLVAEILGEYWLRCHTVASVEYIMERVSDATVASIKSLRKRVWTKMEIWVEKAEIL
jgi:RNA polymerase sigma factor (sigma-70 family)